MGMMKKLRRSKFGGASVELRNHNKIAIKIVDDEAVCRRLRDCQDFRVKAGFVTPT